MKPSINRRDFLRGAAVTSAALIAARSAFAFDTKRHFAPVNVARNRIIREVVGLRPYRPSGFVVDAQRFGSKLLVHNYGHGGGGVTLSWGTASLAVDMARDFLIAHKQPRPAHFAVLGCGVSGLSTARLLQRRFQNGPGTVTIYEEAAGRPRHSVFEAPVAADGAFSFSLPIVPGANYRAVWVDPVTGVPYARLLRP